MKFRTRLALCCLLAVCRLAACFLPDYSDHECIRQCSDDTPPRVCQYQWVLEDYLTLSRACYSCPDNETDCWRHHCVSADGFQRSIKTANRVLPGPTIQVCEGDTVEVVVDNQMALAEGVTIHWHGQLQKHSPHMDGVGMITQCPISAFSSFTYRFLAEYPGTHFWHSHAGVYRGDGLFGSLVVRQTPSRDPHQALYDYDLPEHVIVLNDWSHQSVVDIFTGFYHSDKPQTPDAILINGRGKYKPKEDEKDQPQTPFAEFQVEAGRRYRFRVVNAGSLKCPIVLSIDGHQLLLIASDGKPFQSFLVDSFVSFSGERYDFVLEVKTNSSSILWMRAKGLLECQARNIQQLAVVRVRGGKGGEGGNLLQQQQLPFPPVEQERPSRNSPDFNGWLLAPSTSDAASQISKMTSLAPDDPSLKKTPDKRFFLEFAYRFRNNTHFHDPDLYPVNGKGYKSAFSAVVNNISNVLPPSPFLSQPNDIDQSRFCDVKSKGPRCPDDFCECFHRMVVEKGEVVELVVSNANNDLLFTHPIHLHGYSFRVVAIERLAEEMTEDLFRDLDNQGLVRRRLHGAPLKDTVPIPDGGYLVLRLEANNPGVWFLHCHVAFHAEIGMALTFHVNDVDGRLPAVPSDFPRCGIWPTVHHQHLNAGPADTAASTPIWVVPVVVALCVVIVLLVAQIARQKHQQARKGKYVTHFRFDGACAGSEAHVSSDDERKGLL